MKKKKIGIAVYIVIITVTAITVFIRSFNRTYNGAFERTNEEYMAILTDNQDDFEYVARTMQQWDEGSISFEDPYGRPLDFDDILIKNQEIESEISSSEDFYKSLHNLYDLDEVDRIVIEEDAIMFHYSKPPQNYRCGVAYGGKESDWPAIPIDGNWVLKMIPNT